MKSSNLMKIFLILLVIIVIATGETTSKPKKRKSSKKKPVSTKNRAHCLTCLTDFKTKAFDQTDTCLNPLANITDAELRYFNMCPEAAKYCMVEIATINQVFVGIERRCTASCTQGCIRDGYGAENENCIYCCPPYQGSEYFDEEAVLECPKYTNNSDTNFNKIKIFLLNLTMSLIFKLILNFD